MPNKFTAKSNSQQSHLGKKVRSVAHRRCLMTLTVCNRQGLCKFEDQLIKSGTTSVCTAVNRDLHTDIFRDQEASCC